MLHFRTSSNWGRLKKGVICLTSNYKTKKNKQTSFVFFSLVVSPFHRGVLDGDSYRHFIFKWEGHIDLVKFLASIILGTWSEKSLGCCAQCTKKIQGPIDDFPFFFLSNNLWISCFNIFTKMRTLKNRSLSLICIICYA